MKGSWIGMTVEPSNLAESLREVAIAVITITAFID